MPLISNTTHWIIEQSEVHSSDFAIISKDKNYTYEEFKNKVIQYLEFLIKKGIKQHHHIGILLLHRYEFYVLINSIWLIGAIPIPINTKNSLNEINYQIEKASIEFIITDSVIANINIPESNIIIINNSYEELNSSNITFQNNYPKYDANRIALILFTSGSTSNPKPVVHSFKNLFNHVLSIENQFMLTENDRWLASLPFYHIGGFMILIRALISGAAVLFPNSLKHEDIKESINLYPTLASFVSTTMKRFLEDNFSFPISLRFIFLGGGPIDNDLVFKCLNKNYPIVKVYGSTETCSMVTALLPKDKNYDSVGKPIDNSTIINIDKSQQNRFGEILIKSSSILLEYYHDEEYTHKKLIDGFYHTGDFGFVDENGYLFILNRREDIIISGGENVSRLEVEKALLSVRGVKEAFVFGVKDETWGQVVYAAIVANSISSNEISKELRKRVASYKIPKKYFFVDSLPKNEMGKILKNQLLKKLNLYVD